MECGISAVVPFALSCTMSLGLEYSRKPGILFSYLLLILLQARACNIDKVRFFLEPGSEEWLTKCATENMYPHVKIEFPIISVPRVAF